MTNRAEGPDTNEAAVCRLSNHDRAALLRLILRLTAIVALAVGASTVAASKYQPEKPPVASGVWP